MTLRGVGRACSGSLMGLLCVVLAGTTAPSVAADELRYSLGTIQSETSLSAPPGGSDGATLAFYNIDGNVPTIVELYVAEAPPWCAVTLDHAAFEAGAESLTLRIEPSAPQVEVPECAGAGLQSFLVEPRGYVCADVIGVRVHVDGSADEGESGAVRLLAVARWESPGGSALPPQEREFVLDITVVAGTETTGSRAAGDTPLWMLVVAALALACVVLLSRLLAKSGRLA